VRFGTILPLFNGRPQKTLAAAREAEELGFDAVFVFDHFFPPGAPSHLPALEAFTMLAAVAEATERVRLGTLVTRASLRPPGLLAKMIASIDAQSGGRVIVGVGTGDKIDLPEHEAYGFETLSLQERRAYLAEAVAALKALFAGETWHGGDHVPKLTGPLLPPPASPGGPPIWIGAQGDAVVRLAASIADGWNGWGMEVDRFAGKVATLRAAAGEAGRDVTAAWAGIVLVGEDEAETEALREARAKKDLVDEAWSGTVQELIDLAAGLGEAGAEWVTFVPAGPADRRRLIGERVLPALR
jgi:alkanesulfonate monooxygenase SsuD/methylene tetrahydromethanopterin reductase-like flavin-dependent oxidoreductase (luciferase family)